MCLSLRKFVEEALVDVSEASVGEDADHIALARLLRDTGQDGVHGRNKDRIFSTGLKVFHHLLRIESLTFRHELRIRNGRNARCDS